MKNWIKRYWKRTGVVILLAMGVMIGLGYGYLKSETYEAVPEAVNILEEESVEEKEEYLIVEPENFIGNIVFYQGGLVESEAYLPLAQMFSEEGYRVFIPYMPLKLAIIDSDVFEEIYDENSSDLPWYIGGHSLGGTSALLYAENHTSRLSGIFLLGSYPAEGTDLSEAELPVLSIYAENDQIIDQDNYKKSKSLLPDETSYEIIQGGNHSNFGSYGLQDGDGKSKLTREEQQQQVIEYFISNLE